MPKSKKKKTAPAQCAAPSPGGWTATLDFEGPPPSANVTLEDSLRDHISRLEADRQRLQSDLREIAGTDDPITKQNLLHQALLCGCRSAEQRDIQTQCHRSGLVLHAAVTAYARQRNISMQAVTLELRDELERRNINPLDINAVIRACTMRIQAPLEL